MPLRFAGPFVLVAAIPLLHAWNVFAPLLSVAALLVYLLALERGAGRDAATTASPRLHRLVSQAYIPLQLAVIAWGCWAAARPTATTSEIAVLVLSIGICAGVFGMLTAHEMVHSHKKAEIALGLAMLTGMTYRHFRVAHVYGHHRYAGTARDPGTARLGESAYGFVGRTVVMQIVEAWRFETARLARRQRAVTHHRVLQDGLIYAALYGALILTLGPVAALFLLLESLVAIIVLELFNYIAHYGLMRREMDGRFEPFGDRHSWNTSNAAANAMIFNMGRHSDHHRRPAAPYEQLQPVETAPELPAGYAGSILMALIPPLWRRVMDPAVRRLSV